MTAEPQNERPFRIEKMPPALEAALQDLMILELKTSSPGRFSRVSQLAQSIQQIAQMYFQRVEDEVALAQAGRLDNPYRNVFADFQPGLRGYRQNHEAYRGLTTQEASDLHRDVSSTLMPIFRAVQLNALVQVRNSADELGLDKNKITDQIKEVYEALSVSMARPKEEKKEECSTTSSSDDSGPPSNGATTGASNGCVLEPVTTTVT